MNLRNRLNLVKLSRKSTEKEKDKEWKEVAEENKVDFAIDNSTNLRDPE